MIWYIWLAYLAGTFTTFIVMRGMIKHMRARNAELMNESDYHFMMGKLFYKTLSSEQQKEVDDCREIREIRETRLRNIKQIRKTGKY